ncbi:MAG: hypothetical protein GY936_15080, partial [Ignavibacteriae bacterium]|nr:hypothetical protein [Ignavibacteriota bacterium]
MIQRFISSVFFITLVILTQSSFSQTTTPLLRKPSINNNGTQIAFSYQGDIW